MEYKGPNQPSLGNYSGSLFGWLWNIVSFATQTPAYKSPPEDSPATVKKK